MSGSSQQTQSNQTQQTNMGPWAPQQGYLLDAFNQAQNAENTANAQGPYSGNYVAPTNQNQYNAYNGAYNFASGMGANTVNGILNTGNANNATGWNAAGGALGGMANFANNDQTAHNVANAGQYADNPYISSMVQSSMADENRNAAESTIPNLYRNAAASGNINSDRTALAQGVVQRGLDEDAGKISANLRGNAYNTGIGAALQGNAQGLQALSQEGSLGANMGQSGLNALSTGINDQGALNNMGAAGANGVQALDQSNLNNSIQQYQQNQNFPWQQLQNYYNIVGNRSWGQNGTTTTQGNSTTQNTPSTLSTIGSLVGGVGSLFGSGGLLGSGGALGGLMGNLGGGMSAADGTLGQGSSLYNMAQQDPSMIQGYGRTY